MLGTYSLRVPCRQQPRVVSALTIAVHGALELPGAIGSHNSFIASSGSSIWSLPTTPSGILAAPLHCATLSLATTPSHSPITPVRLASSTTGPQGPVGTEAGAAPVPETSSKQAAHSGGGTPHSSYQGKRKPNNSGGGGAGGGGARGGSGGKGGRQDRSYVRKSRVRRAAAPINPLILQYERELWDLTRAVLQRRAHISTLAHVFDLWSKYQRAGYPPTPRVLSSIVSAYAVAQCPRIALRLAESFPSLSLTKPTFLSLLQSAQRTNDVTAYIATMELMERAGSTFTQKDGDGLFLLCLQVNDMERAPAVLERMIDVFGPLSKAVCRKGLDTVVKSGNASRANILLKHLLDTNAVDASELGGVLQALMSLAHSQFDPTTCTLLVECFLAAGITTDRQAILKLLQVAGRRGSPALAIRTNALAEFSKVSAQTEYMNSLIRARAASSDILEILTTLQEMDTERGKPSKQSFESAVVSIGKWLHRQESIDVVETALRSLEGRVSHLVINCVIAALGRIGQAEAVHGIVSNMEMQYRCKPDEATFALALEACHHPRRVNVRIAQDIVTDMRRQEIAMGSEAYSALIHVLLRSGHVENAAEAMHKAMSEDAMPSSEARSAVVRKLARGGYFDEATRLIKELRAISDTLVKPSLIEYVQAHKEGKALGYAPPE